MGCDISRYASLKNVQWAGEVCNKYIYHAKSRLDTPVWGLLRSPNYIYNISREISIEHPSVGLASLAQLITPTSVTLEILDLDISLPPTISMTHCGMVRDVAVQACAVSSTHLRGSVSLYPSLQVMTWR